MTRVKPPFVLALLAALLMALPAASAVAQSAGDNQYQDPLGGGNTPTKPNTTTPPPPARAAGSSTPSRPTHARASRSVPLARTGFDAWIPGVLGLTLLVLGALLLRWPRRRIS